MDLIEQIRLALEQATRENQKSAMLHAQVLIHTDELARLHPDELCRQLNLLPSYATEIQKMIAASRVLRQLGYAVTRTT